MNRRPALLPVLLAVSIAAACSEEPAPAPSPPPQIKIFEVRGGGGGTLEYPGVVSTARTIDLAFEVPGRIVDIPVIEGQQVEEGDLLAALDPRDFESRLEAKRAVVRQAKAEFERAQKLYAEEVIPRQEYDLKLALYDVQRSEVVEEEKALADTRLLAPFDGFVAKRYFREYKNVQAKEPVFVFQDDDLELIVNIPEADFATLTPGLTLEQRTAQARPEVVVSSIPGRRFPAVVKEFSTTADPVTRTFAATFAFESPSDVTVSAGMTAHVVIHRRSTGSRGFQVPVQSVRSDASDEPFVWTIDPESMTVTRTPVSIGTMNGDSIEITSGLQPGQLIAASGVHHLEDGMVVRRFGN